ncbi:MAG: cobalt-precorrin-5B (C(1))-methyltransferase [Actinomycetota bacterium]|nr:cobalt-precorrin-5B (C(1))-methyltransferase [Actinomycetota bacterium]
MTTPTAATAPARPPRCASGTWGAHVLHAGEGIGAITRSALGPALGEPAINPVPGRVITTAPAEDRTVL